METSVIIAIIGGVETLIQNEPAIAASIKAIFATGGDTAAGLASLRASIVAQSYAKFVPASDLPKEVPTAAFAA